MLGARRYGVEDRVLASLEETFPQMGWDKRADYLVSRVVVPRERVAAVAEAADAREKKEEANRKRLAAGELGLDLYGMRDALAKAGLKYLD